MHCTACRASTPEASRFCPFCGRPLVEAPDVTRLVDPGAILAARCRIVRLPGRGGMGVVYQADDLRLGPPVARRRGPPVR